MNRKQYQFRATPDLEEAMRQVWDNTMNTTGNLIKILKAGVATLKITTSKKERSNTNG